MIKISVVINAFNSEKELEKVISSVKDLANEVIVVDQNSTDKTEEKARELGAIVFNHKKVQYVELARNFAISKATGDWILILDPDEEIPQSLRKRIKTLVKENKADYYRIARKNIIFGKWMKHSRWWPDYNIRLFKKDFVIWDETIHSVPITKGRGLDLEAEEKYSILHHHYDSIDQYIERMNRYTSTQAELKLKSGYTFSWTDLISKPSNEFFSRYFFGNGYKDGIHGLALSLLQSFSELVVYLKIWQMNKFVESNVALNNFTDVLKKSATDLKYWQADAKFRESGSLLQRVKRKLKI